MKFGAEGKGPLELPRLSSLGPFSKTSEDVGELIFRGSNIEDFNADEFQDNTIDGRPVTIWVLDAAAVAKRYDLDPSEVRFTNIAGAGEAQQAIIDEFRIGPEDVNEYGVDTGSKEVPIEDLEDVGLIARKLDEHVTGGLSSNAGAGFRFAGTGGTSIEQNAPLVMFLEKNRIPARLTKVEYTPEFINEHPELAGAADKGGRMLMAPHLDENYELGDFTAQYGVGPARSNTVEQEGVTVDEGTLLVLWFKNPLDNFRKLEPEQEMFAHTNEIDLDHSLFGICHYTGRSRLERHYKNAVGDPEGVSIKEQAVAVHEEIKNRIIANEERLVTCVLKNEFRTSQKRLPRNSFFTFYDGEQFTDDYDEAIPFTDPTRF